MFIMSINDIVRVGTLKYSSRRLVYTLLMRLMSSQSIQTDLNEVVESLINVCRLKWLLLE